MPEAEALPVAAAMAAAVGPSPERDCRRQLFESFRSLYVTHGSTWGRNATALLRAVLATALADEDKGALGVSCAGIILVAV